MARKITVTMQGPAVAKFVVQRWPTLPRTSSRDLRLGAGLFAVYVTAPLVRDTAGIAADIVALDEDAEITVAVIDQASDIDDPDTLVARSLRRINDATDGLAAACDKIEVRVE